MEGFNKNQKYKSLLRYITYMMATLDNINDNTSVYLLNMDQNHKQASISFNTASFLFLNSHKERFLHVKEIQYYEAIKHTPRMYSYLQGRFAAKKALYFLTQYDDVKSILIENGIFQQPVVNCSMLHGFQISISHTINFSGAIAHPESYPMAIDIEKIQYEKNDVILSQLTKAEVSLFSKLANHFSENLFLAWTIKEGLSKALKCGFAAHFNIFEIESIQYHGGVYLSKFVYFKQFHAVSFFINDYALSIIYPKDVILIDDFIQIRNALIGARVEYK